MGSYPIYKSKISFFLMFFKNYQVLFIFTLIIGTIIAVSTNSWFTRWLGLEINLISIIPLILSELNTKITEASIKYFLSQAIASILLIFGVNLKFYTQEFLNIENLEIILTSALLIKAGIAPFHLWFPQVRIFLNWFQCILIFTWQKIAPLILICSINLKIALAARALSAVVGALGGLNQKNIKLILTYSSISHRAWIIIACVSNFKIWVSYFLIYCFLSFSIILFFYTNQINFINNVFSRNDSFLNKRILSLNLLSLGGIPPLLGFSAKVRIIIISLKLRFLTIFIPLILRSLISLFFYFRLIYTNFIFSNSTINLKILNENKPLGLFFTIRIFLNITAPIILTMI